MTLVEPRPEEAQEYYVRIPVNLRLAGRYHQLAKFFYNVSRLERAINMENVHLTEPVVVGDEVRLSVDVLATTFRRPGEGDVPPDPAGGAPAGGGS
jgi:type IV pilus assembly protein PilO